MGLIITSAVKFEALPLLEELEKKGIDFKYVECGIGAINAAKNSKEVAKECAGNDVIHIGTCGTFGSFEKPTLVVAAKAHWITPCERAGISWALEGLDKPVDLPQAPEWASELMSVEVICCSTIAKSSEIAPQVVETHKLPTPEKLVENLELYSIANEVVGSAKSFVCLLGISNAICKDGRKQWKENFKSLAKITSEFIIGKSFS